MCVPDVLRLALISGFSALSGLSQNEAFNVKLQHLKADKETESWKSHGLLGFLTAQLPSGSWRAEKGLFKAGKMRRGLSPASRPTGNHFHLGSSLQQLFTALDQSHTPVPLQTARVLASSVPLLHCLCLTAPGVLLVLPGCSFCPASHAISLVSSNL